MPMEILPNWLTNLDEEYAAFIKNFLLVSGSPRDIAAHYDVPYPNIALNDRIDYDTAKPLIAEYRRLHGKTNY